MAANNRDRELLYGACDKHVAVPIPIVATPISDTLYRFTVTENLGPGEYGFSADGPIRFFCSQSNDAAKLSPTLLLCAARNKSGGPQFCDLAPPWSTLKPKVAAVSLWKR